MTHARLTLLGAGIGVMVMLNVGCGHQVDFSGAQNNSEGSVTAPPAPTTAAQVPACEINISQLELGGNVNTFSLTDSVGVSFGYNQNGALGGLGGSASVSVSNANMDLSMVASDPMSGAQLANTDVSSGQTTTNIGGSVDFSQMSVNPTYYLQTPLATVSQKAITSGLSSLASATASLAWIGRVLEDIGNNQLIINSGSTGGVQVGDTFTIYNVTQYWAGTPCASTYYGSQPDSSSPTATATVVAVSTSTSVITLEAAPTEPIRDGAEVHILQLVQNSSLKKNVLVGTITSQTFNLPGGGTFNFQSVMSSQLQSLLSSSGFVLNVN